MGKRETILPAVKAACESASVAGGYNFDLSGKVFEWRSEPFSANDTVIVNIKDSEVKNASQGTGFGSYKISNNLTVVFEITAKSGTDVRLLISDLKKICGLNRAWGAAGCDTRYVSDTIRISAQEGSTITTFTGELVIIINYETLEWES